MPILEKLQPQAVFAHFEHLCAIPHGSGNTKAISDYLVRFAAARGLRHIQDAHNNVIIFCPGTPGYEAAAPVILQGHMDMVCETAPDCATDLTREGLDLFVDGDTIGARGTTLGGDDGIAVAMALAILDSSEIAHPALEAVFTVDEEIGMEGAQGLDFSQLSARRMLNIDSEEEGIFTVSCAGGASANVSVGLTMAPNAAPCAKLTVSGLKRSLHLFEEVRVVPVVSVQKGGVPSFAVVQTCISRRSDPLILLMKRNDAAVGLCQPVHDLAAFVL